MNIFGVSMQQVEVCNRYKNNNNILISNKSDQRDRIESFCEPDLIWTDSMDIR